MDECRVIPVIRTTLGRRGMGTPDDPHRVITEYFTLEGELLWEVDVMGAELGQRHLQARLQGARENAQHAAYADFLQFIADARISSVDVDRLALLEQRVRQAKTEIGR